MTETEDFDDPERSYRRGFTHGAWEAISALRGQLPPRELERLERWFAGAQQWRASGYRGESRRSPGKHVTMDILPPKIGWPF